MSRVGTNRDKKRNTQKRKRKRGKKRERLKNQCKVKRKKKNEIDMITTPYTYAHPQRWPHGCTRKNSQTNAKSTKKQNNVKSIQK